MSMRAIIMTGGRGVRLRPYTDVLPKGLLPVGGKPILETIITQLRRSGFQQITLVCGYLGWLIETYFGDGGRLGVHLDYYTESEPKGTIGALRDLGEWSEPRLVMNCDVLTTLDYQGLFRYHKANSPLITVASQMKSIPISLGVVETDEERVTGLFEKPETKVQVSMGIYVVEPKALDYIPQNACFDAPQLIQSALKNGQKVLQFRNDAYWLDIGTPEDYQSAQGKFQELHDAILAGGD